MDKSKYAVRIDNIYFLDRIGASSDGRRKISRARNFPWTSGSSSTGSTASKREREQRGDIPPTSRPPERPRLGKQLAIFL
jgi:hypothetical protein